MCLVGSLVLVTLTGCGRSWFAEREPWRREAEIACLKSGTVKEGPEIAQIQPISGPGLCGADFPFKVAALGESSALGFAESVRPPGDMPRLPVQGVEAEAFSEHRPPLPSRWSRSPVRRDPLAPSHGAPLAVGRAEITPPATLACPIVSALDSWIARGIQPAALRWFGQPVAEIKQISAYSCRGMNGQRGAKISEHAFGNALDIAAFTLADGRIITVREGWRGLPEEQGFLRDVHASACERFSTTLGPGSNVYHYDHLHVDLMRRASGQAICNPAPVAGEIVAARVGRGSDRAKSILRAGPVSRKDPWERRDDPFSARRPSDPGVTGSTGTLRERSIPTSNGRAIPGED